MLPNSCMYARWRLTSVVDTLELIRCKACKQYRYSAMSLCAVRSRWADVAPHQQISALAIIPNGLSLECTQRT